MFYISSAYGSSLCSFECMTALKQATQNANTFGNSKIEMITTRYDNQTHILADIN